MKIRVFYLQPNAVDVLWPQWILSSLSPSARSQDVLQQLMTQQHAAAEQFQKVAELCLLEGYITTLHEAMLIFMPVSYTCYSLSFLNLNGW